VCPHLNAVSLKADLPITALVLIPQDVSQATPVSILRHTLPSLSAPMGLDYIPFGRYIDIPRLNHGTTRFNFSAVDHFTVTPSVPAGLDAHGSDLNIL